MNTTPHSETRVEPGSQSGVNRPALGVMVAIAGWIVPGLGHLLMKRWAKAIVYFVCIGGLACAGLLMQGVVFPASSTELLDRLGFFADMGTGSFYFLARVIEAAGPDVSHASGDYGTRLFAAAGVLNLLVVLEAFEIGRGQKDAAK